MAINFSTGFNLRTTEPIDKRFVLTKTEMYQERFISNNTVIPLPESYLCVCSDDNRLYVYSSKNSVQPGIGRFRLASGITAENVEVKGLNYNYIENYSNPIQVRSAIEDGTGKNIAEALSEKQPIITNDSKISADLISDSLTVNKFVTTVDKINWNSKQNALTAGAGISIENNVISSTLVETTYTKEETDAAIKKSLAGNIYTLNNDGIPTFPGALAELKSDIKNKLPIDVQGVTYRYLTEKVELLEHIDPDNPYIPEGLNGITTYIYYALDYDIGSNSPYFKFLVIEPCLEERSDVALGDPYKIKQKTATIGVLGIADVSIESLAPAPLGTFVGWYYDSDFTLPFYTTPIASAHIKYPKYVNPHTFNIIAQYSPSTTASSMLGYMRFITTIDANTYRSVSFTYKVNQGIPQTDTVTTYTTTVAPATDPGATLPITILPGISEIDTEIFSTDSAYFATSNLASIVVGGTMTVTATFIAADGTEFTTGEFTFQAEI